MRITGTEWTEKMDGVRIIADAGGTKTDWRVLVKGEIHILRFTSSGINASITPDEQIIENLHALHAFLKENEKQLEDYEYSLSFFGAGCNSDSTRKRIEKFFKQVFGTKLAGLEIRSDLEGAAIALFGNKPGVACILGTGSASGLYNGKKVIDSVPSLGYLLGDEGSGAYMGRKLLNSLYKRDLSEKLKVKFEERFSVNISEILEKVYRRPGANAYLASFVPFLKENENNEEIDSLISESLKLFFFKNVLKYNIPANGNIGFIGGVAMTFKEKLEAVSKDYNLNPVRFLNRPIEMLAEYYQNLRT